MPALRIVLALFLAFAIAACGDDDNPSDNNGGNNNNNNSSFKNEATATLNGNQWTATNVTATRNEAGGIVALTFVAYGADDSQIAFGVAFASVKTFTIDGSAVQASFKYGGTTYGDDETGTITITTLTDKGMKGSFTINAKSGSTGANGTATGNFDVAFN